MINKLKYWCHKVLPLVYDESLSYYEVLCKLNAKVNEVIDVVNSGEAITENEIYVTPQMFGAKGDGIANDTVAVQSAINFASTNKIVCYIPSGTYNTTNIYITSNVILKGDGKTITTLKHIGVNDVITIKPINIDSWNKFINVEISSFSIEGNENTNCGLVISETVASNFEYISVKNCEVGIFINGESNVVTNKNSVFNNDYNEISVNNCRNIGIKVDGIFSDNHFNRINIENVPKCFLIETIATHNVSFTNGSFGNFEQGLIVSGILKNVLIELFNFEQFSDGGIIVDIAENEYINNYTIINCSFYPNTVSANCIRCSVLDKSIICNNNILGGQTTTDILITKGTKNVIFNNSKINGGAITINVPNQNLKFGYTYKGSNDVFKFEPTLYCDSFISEEYKFINSKDKTTGIALFNDYYLTIKNANGYNTYVLPALTTSERNALQAARNGSCVFDTTLNKPVWRSNDSVWVDATGTVV